MFNGDGGGMCGASHTIRIHRVLLFSVQNWYREMHMNSLMLNTAQELSSAEAGGHGDRWGVFAGGTETAIRRVMATIKDAELVAGIIDKAAMENVVAGGEPKSVLLLYTGQEKGVSKTGAMSLIGQNEKTGRNELWSAYPMLGDGSRSMVLLSVCCSIQTMLRQRLKLDWRAVFSSKPLILCSAKLAHCTERGNPTGFLCPRWHTR